MNDKQRKTAGKIIKFFAIIGTTYGGIWVLLDSIGIQSGVNNAITAGVFSILLSLLFLSVKYNINERRGKYYIHPENLEFIQKLLKNTKELKIFSSGSGGYRVKIQMILKNIETSNLKRIKILIRDDVTPEREIKIQDQIRQWEHDIKSTYSITIEYYRYNFSNVALRGYIFDNKYALLGWYYNDGTIRRGNDKILSFYSSEYEDQMEIIQFANDTFDGIIQKNTM